VSSSSAIKVNQSIPVLPVLNDFKDLDELARLPYDETYPVLISFPSIRDKLAILLIP